MVAAGLGDGFFEKVGGEAGDFGVGQATVRFADDFEFAGLVVADGEGGVAEDVFAFAMAVFGGDNDAIQSRKSFLEFEPGEAAAAGGVDALGVFNHEAFVAAGAGGGEGGFDVFG